MIANAVLREDLQDFTENLKTTYEYGAVDPGLPDYANASFVAEKKICTGLDFVNRQVLSMPEFFRLNPDALPSDATYAFYAVNRDGYRQYVGVGQPSGNRTTKTVNQTQPKRTIMNRTESSHERIQTLATQVEQLRSEIREKDRLYMEVLNKLRDCEVEKINAVKELENELQTKQTELQAEIRILETEREYLSRDMQERVKAEFERGYQAGYQAGTTEVESSLSDEHNAPEYVRSLRDDLHTLKDLYHETLTAKNALEDEINSRIMKVTEMAMPLLPDVVAAIKRLITKPDVQYIQQPMYVQPVPQPMAQPVPQQQYAQQYASQTAVQPTQPLYGNFNHSPIQMPAPPPPIQQEHRVVENRVVQQEQPAVQQESSDTEQYAHAHEELV